MENASLQVLLPTAEEIEEPWPKKLKIERNNLSPKVEKVQLLGRLCYVDRSCNKTLSFPEVLYNFDQNNLELQEKICTSFKTNIGQCAYLKPCMNTTSQSRLLQNIPFIEKWAFENKHYNISKENYSESNENNKQLITKSGQWTSYVKEREKSIDSSSISRQNELPTGSVFFIEILAEKLISRMERMFSDLTEFKNKKYTGLYDVCEKLKSEKQYQILNPIKDCGNSYCQTLHFCLPVRSFKKEKRRDLESLFYEYKKVAVEDNILSYKMQRRCTENKTFRSKTILDHMYISCSRNCGVVNLKLIKGDASEFFVPGKGKRNWRPVTENDSQIILFDTQQREVSNEKSNKECLIVSKDATEDENFSLVGNEKGKMVWQLLFSNNPILPDNNFNNSSLWEHFQNPKTMYNLSVDFILLSYLNRIPTIFEKLQSKHSNLQRVVTMETNMQRKNRNALNENNVFSFKRFKTSHFVLKTQNKHATRKFRNSICSSSKAKYMPRYVGTCSKAKDKKRCDNCEECQDNPCHFVDKETNVSPFDTFKKICLNIDSEEVDQIPSILNVTFYNENNENYSKECTAIDKRLTSSSSDTLTYSCILPKLLTNSNSLLEEPKDKKSQNFRDKNINIHGPQYEINNTRFPAHGFNSGNTLKCLSDVDQYFISAMSYNLRLNQNRGVSIKVWHSKIALHKKRSRKRRFVSEYIVGVLQSQPVCSSGVSNRLKHPKVKKVENANLLLQKDILLRGTCNSDLLPVKQNAENTTKTGNEIEQSCTSKRNNQNLTQLCEYGNLVGSKDKFTMDSWSKKQKHCQDIIENQFSSEINKKYEIEVKKQFDLVLEELHIFNGIGQENENSLSHGERDILETKFISLKHSDSIMDYSKAACENKLNTTFSTLTAMNYSTMAKQNKKNEQSLFKDKLLERPGEQEAPPECCSPSTSHEELYYSSSKEQCDLHCTQAFPWNLASAHHTFMKKENYCLQMERENPLLHGIIRVQPLKTCRGPLRVGLSRRAKPKHLHPYLK